MTAALIGNVPDLERLRKLCKKYGMIFILDSCDTLGATWNEKPIGKYADVITSSFYGSHVITTAGAGGIIATDDKKLAEKFLVLRGWGRTSALFGESEDIEKRFNTKIDGIPYDSKFIFIEKGFNMQPTEIQGAFGVVQLKKLEQFNQKRIANFRKIYAYFKKKPWFILPMEHKDAWTGWMNFPLTLTRDCPFKRRDIVLFLEKNDIQTRPLFTGNVLRQPGFKYKGARPEQFKNADYVMRNTFVIGCHQGLTKGQLAYLFKTFDEFFRRYAKH